jgi:7-cyano-7-deazaguanine tRNA-ribosyltransferase
VYGAGDPVELPFFVRLGATAFDSASYGHYAAGGFYMTPYGALKDPGPLIAGEYACPCPHCTDPEDFAAILVDKERLTMHNLWTICDTVETLRDLLRKEQSLDRYLEQVLDIHARWFPDSQLGRSWNDLFQ